MTTNENKIEDGGPAFPVPGLPGPFPECGMNLRDYFAAKAMQGDWASQNVVSGVFHTDTPEERIKIRADFYYKMADAMLKARKL